ncbi:replication protein [Clostridium botulinum B2 128]|uniref:DnaD domain-containing protein n=1 Tax=Clostridium botulinum TaxID=1491 RepID=UPI0007E16D89|nr:DnaD domain protein [Clostridium botulinum]KEI74954.1 replication protein [Clostridium botulinum B2 128]KEI88680.1 replication protein [Clostridium botulinum B2 433]NFI41472.1 DnaD domain protein [Clostridium botulinum]NFI76128.1 DnaD domain protein [Clostridium botulinum]NFI83900.1 DnaD domain protein [Clostridium botulinum]
MAKYRQLYTEFWKDGFVVELEPEEKYFYLYLLTNVNTSQCGIYELPKKIMENETGYNRETVDNLIKKFEEYKKIIYSEETKEIIMLNWFKYNEPNNINAIKCVNKELKKIKNRNFVKELYFQYSKSGLEVDKLFYEIEDGFIKDKNNKVKDIYISITDHSNSDYGYKNIDRNSKFQNEFMDIDKNIEIETSDKHIARGNEGAYKGPVSKEIINNKQKEINNKKEVISNSCCSNKEKESKYNNINKNSNCEFKSQKELKLNNTVKSDEFNKGIDIATAAGKNTTATEEEVGEIESCRANVKNIRDVIAVFENNIHKMAPIERKKIINWSNKFSYDVIVMAIEEAIFNNIKNIGYIEKILDTWFSKGLTSIGDIKSYKARWEEKKKKIKSKENTVDRWNDFEQREYDFEKLERKLLGWEMA